MNTNKLPVYKKTLDLIKSILSISEKFPRYYRYTLGEELSKKSINLISIIVKANLTNKPDRVNILNEFIAEFEIIKSIILICSELKILSINSQSVLGLLIEDIGKQITNWKKSSIE